MWNLLAARREFCYEAPREGADMDIENLIPHRGRMRLIGEVLTLDDDRALTSSIVSENWPLYRDGAVEPLVAVELVAQTAALLEGWKQQQSGGRGGTTGWLVGIKEADFRIPCIPLSATLVTEAGRGYAMEGYAVFEGRVRLGSETAATVIIQVFRPEEGDEPAGPEP